ncbi:MAG: sensor histidine kinase, partial [Myxococcota bacterium]
LPRIHANGGQLQQVLLNLLQNSLQALPSEAGKISLTAGALDAERVFFRVSDTGTGIKPEHLPRIFEPTFTTKPAGKGTGFGMAVADAIVREHGGSIHVDSEVGRGTHIEVRLPCKSTSFEQK